MAVTEHTIDANLQELITGIDLKTDTQYPVEKLSAHERNVPHLAISIFIFNGRQLLLQRRAATKYHSGGLWANTVCSHPRWEEPIEECAERRLQEELGWCVPLTEFARIDYASPVGELFENERVHCFFGRYDNSCSIDNFDREEVSEVKWLNFEQLQSELCTHPENFSAWFRIYLREHASVIYDLFQTHALEPAI